MDSLKVSSAAFDAAGDALKQAGGFLSAAKQVHTGNAGHWRLIAKGQEVATAWQSAIGPLTDAVVADGKQSIAAGQEFERIDHALAGTVAGKAS